MRLPSSMSTAGTSVKDMSRATTMDMPSSRPIVWTNVNWAMAMARNAMMTVAPEVTMDSPAQVTEVWTACSLDAPLILSSR